MSSNVIEYQKFLISFSSEMVRRKFTLEPVNERLKTTKVSLIVFQRDEKLSLRGIS